jgi:hypothetical protein
MVSVNPTLEQVLLEAHAKLVKSDGKSNFIRHAVTPTGPLFFIVNPIEYRCTPPTTVNVFV